MKIGEGLTFLIGGARSGKSDLAVKLGLAWPGTILFAATAENPRLAPDDKLDPDADFDADMADRIDRHQLERPAEWDLIECPVLGAADVAPLDGDALLIVDCLTLLVSNLLFTEQPVEPHITDLAAALAARSGPSIVVSNEVGMGVHPVSELGRIYRDQLGIANRIMASAADTALLLIAGRALELESVSW